MEKSVGFIGGGRVTRILLNGFRNKNVQFGKIVVADISHDVLAKIKNQFPEIEVSGTTDAAGQDIVFIALHPPVLMDTLGQVKGSIKPGAIVVSLAPKINLAKLSASVPQVKNIARLIPNATSWINEGYNPVTFASGFELPMKDKILGLLRNLGTTFEVPEEKLESYAIISAMLPTYFWFQWTVMEEIGQKTGLTGKESGDAIYDTINASLNLLYRSGLTAPEVIDLIPVKPIGEHEEQIAGIYRTKLIGLFEKIKP